MVTPKKNSEKRKLIFSKLSFVLILSLSLVFIESCTKCCEVNNPPKKRLNKEGFTISYSKQDTNNQSAFSEPIGSVELAWHMITQHHNHSRHIISEGPGGEKNPLLALRFDAKQLQDLINTKGAQEIWVFPAVRCSDLSEENDENKNFTFIIAGTKAGDGGNQSLIIDPQMMFEYALPCPTKCQNVQNELNILSESNGWNVNTPPANLCKALN